MPLTGTQIGLCFKDYWYLWLTKSLSGLLILGIQIGITAFFMKKRIDNRPKPRRAAERVASPRPAPPERAFTPFDMSVIPDADESSFYGGYTPRNASALSAQSVAEEDNARFGHSTQQAINGARGLHSAAPLELNPELSAIAQNLAEQMARHQKLEHSSPELRQYGGQTLGEIYTAMFQSELTGNRMVKKWMKESKRYMYGYDGRRDNENFTQLVWRSSQEMGVGRARSEDGNWWYGVVVFYPPGNLPGQYSLNVLLPAQ